MIATTFENAEVPEARVTVTTTDVAAPSEAAGMVISD